MYRILLIFFLLFSLLIGCAGRARVDDQRQFGLESSSPFGDSKYRAYATLLLSLIDRKWLVTHLDINNNLFEAKYCHRVSKDCMTIKGNFTKSWKVTFNVVDNSFDDRHALRYIDNLQRSFYKYSNYSTGMLNEKIDGTVYWDKIKNLKK